MGFLFLIFYGCLVIRYPDVEPNPGPSRGARGVLRILCANIRGLHGNLRELSVAAQSYDLVLCSETLVSERRHVAELAIPHFGSPLLNLRKPRAGVLGQVAYVRDGLVCTRQKRFECGCCEYMVLKVCGSHRNFYVFNVYRSPSTDDRVFDCLVSSIAQIQQADGRSSFVVAGDFNCHHENWLGSRTTDCHGRAALDFVSVLSLTQLVHESTHQDGGVLDLVMTDVPELTCVKVNSPIGRSDHSHLSIYLSLRQSVPDVNIRQDVYLKTRVNWVSVADAIASAPWSEIRHSPQPGESLDLFFRQLISKYVPVKSVLVRSRDKPWFDGDCRRAFEAKQHAYSKWRRLRTGESLLELRAAQRRAQSVYDVAERNFYERTRDTLASADCSHKWWSVLKSAVFGATTTIPPLLGTGGLLVTDPVRKANLLLDCFQSKQSREDVCLPSTCHPKPELSSVAFRSSELYRLLLELSSYGGVDPSGMFPLLLKKTAGVLAKPLAAVFRHMLRKGIFPECWRKAKITPIPKGPVSSVGEQYRPISITSVLSKVYEKLAAVRLARFFERRDILPPTQFAFRKGLGTCDALLHISHVIQAALDSGSEARVMQLDFSSAFDRVNHAAILFKLQSIGVGGSFLSMIREFLLARQHCVAVDGCCGDTADVVSGVPQGSVLGPLLFILYTADMFALTENLLISYADDSTLISICRDPSERVMVSDSLTRDLERVSGWCTDNGMLLNPNKTKSIVFSRSRTALPAFPDIVVGGCKVEGVSGLTILGVLFDSKLTFEDHLRRVVSTASQKLGIMRRVRSIFRDRDLVRKCFMSFILPILEYCSPVWRSSAECHLHLLDRVISQASFLLNGDLSCDLWHRRDVASLCMFYKIVERPGHPVGSYVPAPFIPRRHTRFAVNRHSRTFDAVRCRTVQFSRCFVPVCVSLWNSLTESVFDGEGIGSFKHKVNLFLSG